MVERPLLRLLKIVGGGWPSMDVRVVYGVGNKGCITITVPGNVKMRF